jgi:hypothetical protein
MTQKKTEQPEVKPITIYLCLESALAASNWIAKTDAAAVHLARRMATALDTAFDMGADLKDITALSGKFLIVLQQLHLTVETRTASKQEENDGTAYVGDFLRLVKTKNPKPPAKTAQRRATSKPASG